MRRRSWEDQLPWLPLALAYAALAAAVLWMVLAGGCATTPRQRLRTATDTYAATLEVLADYRQAGLLDDETARRVELHRRAARRALDQWRLAVQQDRDTAAPRQAAVDALRAMERAVLEARGGES